MKREERDGEVVRVLAYDSGDDCGYDTRDEYEMAREDANAATNERKGNLE